MSRMIPPETVAALRKFNDISVDNYGIDCTLYVPTNADAIDAIDVYATPADVTYTTYLNQTVLMLWAPNQKMLRKLNIFTEDELPILAFFKNTYKDVAGNDVPLQVIIGSYVVIPFNFVPSTYETAEFEVVDIIIRHAHDATVTLAYKMAPRRVKEA